MCLQAQKRYMEAAEKFGSMKDRVEGLLSTREDAYLGLLDVPHPGVSLTPHSHMLHQMHTAGLNAHSGRAWPSQEIVKEPAHNMGMSRPAVLVIFKAVVAYPLLACKGLLRLTNCTARTPSQG